MRGLVDQAAGYVDLGFARADIARGSRQGAGEVIYGEGKTAAQIAAISAALLDAGQPRVLITRFDAQKAADVQTKMRGGEGAAAAALAGFACAEAATGGDASSARGSSSASPSPAFSYYEEARLGVIGGMPEPDGDGLVVVAAAGTSDVPVAEEAVLTAQFLGNEVKRLYDVGVAGIHRLLSSADVLSRARVVIAVAGMEGALASVVGGMVSCPVIAVPTSVGYGASFGGVTALLAMLNSCASGVSVVNIDNGFGAAYQASLINHLGRREG